MRTACIRCSNVIKACRILSAHVSNANNCDQIFWWPTVLEMSVNLSLSDYFKLILTVKMSHLQGNGLTRNLREDTTATPMLIAVKFVVHRRWIRGEGAKIDVFSVLDKKRMPCMIDALHLVQAMGRRSMSCHKTAKKIKCELSRSI